MCEECSKIRQHFMRDPFLKQTPMHEPTCIYCGARAIQWIQRRVKGGREVVAERCRTVLALWLQFGHDEQRLRQLAKKQEWAVAPERDFK